MYSEEQYMYKRLLSLCVMAFLIIGISLNDANVSAQDTLFSVKINFQNEGGTLPNGYFRTYAGRNEIDGLRSSARM